VVKAYLTLLTLAIALALFLQPVDVFATTTIDFKTPTAFTPAETEGLIADFENSVDINGPNFANAFAFSSTTGYANGKATLGDFPHFEVGLFVNSALTNTQVFQNSSSGTYNGEVVGLGITPALRFGIGLGGGFDFMGKFLTINKDLYDPNLKAPMGEITLDELTLYIIGGRVRYNVIKEKTVIPFLFTFGGISLSAGADISRGIIGITGKYDKTFKPTTEGGFAVEPQFSGNYTTKMSWYYLSTTFQGLVYFELLKLFSFYTGLCTSFGYGWFNFEFDCDGTLTDNISSTTISDVVITSENKYHPMKVIPTYVLGLELNIPIVKIVAESQVNLRNRADVSLTLGLRLTF
jgi:hypothetical protein